jgi:hypothetical protein
MSLDLHHGHVFASNIEATIRRWCEYMGAKVFSMINWLVRGMSFSPWGRDRLHIYDQAPRDRGRDGIHHLGVKVDNLRDVWPRLQAQGMPSPNGLGNITAGDAS